MAKRYGVTVTLCYFKHAVYCNIYQNLNKQFTLYSVIHKNKQTISCKDINQETTLRQSQFILTFILYSHLQRCEFYQKLLKNFLINLPQFLLSMLFLIKSG